MPGKSSVRNQTKYCSTVLLSNWSFPTPLI
jgi:hypothetical protein